MNRLEKLRAISPSDILIFDTETTGLNVGGSRRDEILSLAVMNLDGDVLFCDLLRPSERKKWPKAESINGISPSMVKDKKTIIERRSEDVYKRQRRELFGALAEHDAIRPVRIFAPCSVAVRRALIDRQRE